MCVCQEAQKISISNHSLVTANSSVSQVSSGCSQCGLWIAPHNCNNTFTPPITTVHTYKWRPVRMKLRYSKVVKCPAPVFHFFTCLTTAFLIDKVNFYPFEDSAHHLTLLSLSLSLSLTHARTHTHTHTHTHSKNPITSTQCGCIFSFIKDILTECWLNGTSQHTARLLFGLVLGGASFVSHWQHTTLQQAVLVFCTPFR